MISLSIDTRMINASGIGTYIKNLIPHFINEGSLRITCLGDFEVLSKYHWFPEVEFVNLHSKIFSMSEQIELPKMIPACDIFWSPQYNIPILPIKAKRRVVTIHDVYQLAHFQELPPLKKIYVKMFCNAAVLLSDRIITVSEFSKSEIQKYTKAKENKVIKVYNAVEDHFNDNFHLTPIEEKYILYVGNVKPHKNLNNAIAAFRIVASKYNDLKFYIVGKRDGFGSGCNNIEGWIRGIEDKVIFTGHITEDELKNFYANAKLFIFPSFYEGFGLPILEAMKFNIPIIASTAASLPEVGGDAIEYFDPSDIPDIANKISEVFDGKITFYNNKYRIQLNKFSWLKSAIQHEQIFRTLMQSDR